ncbi:MAG: hypothetical protein M1834_006547 [Cirrosporium novae-zelandiae]|nr:MAG: hypothetical protein M1834_006547 [Cirrosporium novae-zelandiae]
MLIHQPPTPPRQGSETLTLLPLATSTCPSTPISMASQTGKPTKSRDEGTFNLPLRGASCSPTSEEISRRSVTTFNDLPAEIHEGILDHLFGVRAATASSRTAGNSGQRGWNTILRHPRRKQLSDLALVNPLWRRLIQERLYRHIKVKGTIAELQEASEWFDLKPLLRTYVRHIEIWVPVWGNKTEHSHSLPTSHIQTSSIVHHGVVTVFNDRQTGSNTIYQQASHNASIEEIFDVVQDVFPDACVLTLEGGHCKKPPMIKHFKNQSTKWQWLPTLPNIRTFIMKGAWNIIRDDVDFLRLSAALPNLIEWHCTYAQPKSKAYKSMYDILDPKSLPNHLTHLNICLEGFYSKGAAKPNMWSKVYPKYHICRVLGDVTSSLEALTYTGRVCGCFFTHAIAAARRNRNGSRLRSLDLVVKNCCRKNCILDEGTGITNWSFIQAFEALVVECVSSLAVLSELKDIRIRYIDLDAPCPLLNPYFQLKNNQCSGLWNADILALLPMVRPQAQYVELSDGLEFLQRDAEGRLSDTVFPHTRPMGIKASSYAAIADVEKI